MEHTFFWLILTITATALMWVPYIINMIFTQGLVTAMGYEEDAPEMSPWAIRAKKAHYNAVENLVLFAPLILGLGVLGEHSGAVATSAMIYFVARIVHYIVYTARIPYLRTLTFAVAWSSVMFLAWRACARLCAIG